MNAACGALRASRAWPGALRRRLRIQLGRGHAGPASCPQPVDCRAGARWIDRTPATRQRRPRWDEADEQPNRAACSLVMLAPGGLLRARLDLTEARHGAGGGGVCACPGLARRSSGAERQPSSPTLLDAVMASRAAPCVLVSADCDRHLRSATVAADRNPLLCPSLPHIRRGARCSFMSRTRWPLRVHRGQ